MTHRTPQLFVVSPNGELRGTKRGDYAKVLQLAVAAFAALLCVAFAIAPKLSGPTFATGGRDAIPFRGVNGGMFIYASLGGVPHNMQLDTGAAGSTVTVPIARTLIARRQAYVMPGFVSVGMADGSVSPHQVIVVYTVTIGRHVLHNVEMTVMADGANLLLGLSELNAIGNFTIDNSHNQIKFN
jgi:predicted aspartyl protease